MAEAGAEADSLLNGDLTHFGVQPPRAGSYFLEERHNAALLGSSLGGFLVACCFAWTFAFLSVCCWLRFAWESRPDRKLAIMRNVSRLTYTELARQQNRK